MIRFCSCSRGSATPVQLPNYRASSKVCKGCGGKLLVERQGAISESMLSTVGMQLSRVIDPNLNWKVCPKGRQRALRRARTCFNVINHCKISAKSSKGVDELTHNDRPKIGHLPVSESEKLGVSILGRRFSETPETVPFKKRKVPLVRSPSPPAESRRYLSDPDRILEIRSSYCKAEPNATQQSLETISGFGMESDLQDIATYEVIKSDIDLKNVDFSGISLLAAAACDSNLGDGGRDVEDSIAMTHASGDEGFVVLPAIADQHPESALRGTCQHPTDMLDGISEPATDHCATSSLPSKGLDKTEDNALRPSEDVSEKTTRGEFSSRDDRLHWDLNVVMDAWGDCDKSKNSEPSAVSAVGEDCTQDMKVAGEAGQEKFRLQDPGVYDTGCHEDGQIQSGSSVELSNIQGKAISRSDNLAADHHRGKECYLLHGSDDLPNEKNQSEGNSTASLGTTNNECPLHHQDKNYSISAADPGVLTGESAGASFLNSVIKMESFVCSHPDNNVNINGVIPACDPLPTKEESLNEVALEKTISAASLVDIDHHSADTNPTANVVKATNIRSPSAENNVPSYTNCPGDAKTDECPGVGHGVDESSHILVDGNMGKATPAVPEIALTEDLDQTVCADAFKDNPVQTGSEYSRCTSTSMPIGMALAVQAEGPSRSLAANTSFADDVNCTHNVALEIHVDVDYDPDASQTDDEHPVGIEKVDFLGDDASPYEDGEFRESVLNSWGADGETESADYASNHREHNVFEASSVHSQFSISGCENGRMLLVNDDSQIEKKVDKKFTQSGVSCFSLTDSLEAEVGKKCHGKVVKGASANCLSTEDGSGKVVGKTNTSASGSVCHKNSRECELLAEGDGAYLKMRSTGWDRLPDGCGYRDGILDSVGNCLYQNHTIDSGGASKAGESLRRLAGASLRKNLPSQIDKPKSSDVSYNKNNSYLRASRVNGHCSPALKGERDADDHRSVGRSESPLNRYSRGRGHRWVDGHNHWSQYGPAGFTHSSSKNAAAAAVAKVESNGFVVAPDGTLVKAGGLGPSHRVLRHSANASSQNTYRSLGRRSPVETDRSYCMPLSYGNSRESPDRHISSGRGRAHPYGPQMQRPDYRKSFDQLDDDINSSLSVHRPLSRREHSFSPQERPPHMLRSRTGSPSRSRTRSPHNWTSSRRSENRRHGGPSSNLLNRSQNFKSQDRLVRVKSPQQGSGFRDHISPISRDHTSIPHSSRWMNERKDLLDFREHGYKRSSERSPPRRLFSRSHRGDQSGSPRRLKQEEYHQPVLSGRFAEFVGPNRSSRRDGDRDDRRGNVNRYEMIHSVRQYDNGVSTRQFHYDFEGGFRVHPRSKVSSKFEQRGNSRDFDREVECQLGDSARVTTEKKGHFRYARDGNHTDNDKLHEIQQCPEEMDQRMGRNS
ncbi:hypothetical protein IHE45_19G081900 [Dioscorea alata]|uniref:Uncharacterized protein n=3 Tax=Dioscorea alata TaxID=55571 RepID=A0ACB7TZH7_DIOAL|nr:hypothetical protein IHE45_19G081900 [Dioscorea alata]KAH7653472.1 hypothetical protein IHE45_19G081900 [Dioscorea alata]